MLLAWAYQYIQPTINALLATYHGDGPPAPAWPDTDYIGQDVSIGYLNHTDTTVGLYLQETFTFLMLTAEAAIALAPPVKPKKS